MDLLFLLSLLQMMVNQFIKRGKPLNFFGVDASDDSSGSANAAVAAADFTYLFSSFVEVGSV